MTGSPALTDRRLQLRAVDGAATSDALSVLTQATARTPLGAWLYPRREIRAERLREAFGELIHQATSIVLANHGDTTVGAVLWRACPEGEQTHPYAALAACGHPDNARLATLANLAATRHPPEAHDCVLALAVLPKNQGRLVGRTLLTARASSAKPRHLIIPGRWRGLLQLGYLPYGARIDLPHGWPPLQPMRRAAPPPPAPPPPPRRRAPRADPPEQATATAPG